jgi:hypothetical protein
MLSGAAIVPSLQRIQTRLMTPVDAIGFSEAYRTVHDGAAQVESALVFLDSDVNPYAASYEDTPLRFYGLTGVGVEGNPAFDYLVYLPGTLIVSFPIYKLFQVVGLPYDQRWLTLLAYIILILVLPQLVNRPTLKLSLLAAIGLNPLVVGPVLIGMNDIFVSTAVIVAVWALSKQHFAISALAMGLACTFKQSAWFITPFYLLLLFALSPQSQRNRKLMQTAVIIGLVMVIIILPFFLWSPSDFIADVLAYPGGSVDTNVPIRGYTVGVLLVGAGFIASPADKFPFWILQLVFGVPLLIVCLKHQWQQNHKGAMLLCAGFFIMGLGLVSRFFHDNYLGFVVTLMTAGILMKLDELLHPGENSPVNKKIDASA